MTVDALSDVDTCDDGESLMIVAVNVACVDEEWLGDTIIRGERSTCGDLNRRRSADPGNNTDILTYVNGYYAVS